MPRSSRTDSSYELQARLRVKAGRDIALGPGKADLLEQIAASGSIRKAAAKLDMSYMRAWSLVKTMNRCFREPLVESQRGGKEQGGARLTDCGRRMLELYREMEAAALQATAESWRAMREMMKK